MKRITLLIFSAFIFFNLSFGERMKLNGICYDLDLSTMTATVRNSAFCQEYNDYNSLYGSVIIPEVVTFLGKNFEVIEIYDRAFLNNKTITSISLPRTLKRIGFMAFDGCESLESVKTNNMTLSELEESVFKNCSSLRSIDLSFLIDRVPKQMFSGCWSLQKVKIPAQVKVIEESAFQCCFDLKEIDFGPSVTEIGKDAFCGCGFTSIEIPNTVTSMIGECFRDCDNLVKIKFPDSLKYAGGCSNCKKLVEIEFPKNAIGVGGFENCVSLTRVILPSTVEYVGTFAGCTNLTYIYLGESLKTVGDYAFSRCTGLTSITLPATVKEIGKGAFYNCRFLSKIDFLGNEFPTIGENAFEGCRL